MTAATITGDGSAPTIHPWEKAGLGRAPFQWLRVSRRVGPIRYIGKDGLEIQVGAPGQPMGCCAYCGEGIAECHEICSADGKRFIVGCDCVRRVSAPGSKVLTDVERASRDLRNKAARKRTAKAAKVSKARVAELLADEALCERLRAKPSAYPWKAAEGATALDDAEWLAEHAGHAGRVKLIKQLEAL